MKTISKKSFDSERDFYGEKDIFISDCIFDGPADGESALKECSNIVIESCRFHLRYPFWHNNGLKFQSSQMYETCRAPLWYSSHICIYDSKLCGVKALRECSDVKLENCNIVSPEFGWFVDGITVTRCSAEGEYMFLRSNNLHFSNFEMRGKYSFQYITDSYFENCSFDTKDALWHADNVYVKNCSVKGEYLGWYCKNVTFENCIISGTQPLCYCENLKLINCEMTDCDLAFEKSSVDATLTKPIISIKNPLSGKICVPKAEQIIFDEEWAKGSVLLS